MIRICCRVALIYSLGVREKKKQKLGKRWVGLGCRCGCQHSSSAKRLPLGPPVSGFCQVLYCTFRGA